MRFKQLLFIGTLLGLGFTSCNKDDDDGGGTTVPERDRGEQAIEDDEALQEYLSTHFYNYEEFETPPENFDYRIAIDTIAGENEDKIALLDSDALMEKEVTDDSVSYTLYILKVREGGGRKPTFADSTLVGYKGQLLNDNVFDQSLVVPLWFDFPGTITTNNRGQLVRVGYVEARGFIHGLTEFGEATNYTINPDNTVNWENYGIGAIFMPSGLGYFSSAQSGIPAYSPLIFEINLYRAVEADHDRDGIPSWKEDLDEDENLFNDDTDQNRYPNYFDTDDDGDGTPTRREITILQDGTVEFPDKNNDGTPDYLDPDIFQE
ncbi:FKBP-type peptidyl-prolyl cis-trans isomerase [Autumnicola musiva]|uniref:peptidylprolyl isomerase n=1 Tax=Autumnicola musiva TaxID=3075589 RepID=A0ABU3DC89_9FLAO|nr:hypothetical protein [Zunongwangia sp. F117]MDT0678588.1 hypothetical protein [Zunongwangia sp. F117]